MGKKVCGECGAARGTPHGSDCSNSGRSAALREDAQAAGQTARGVLVSRTPLRKEQIQEGLALSRGSGRIAYHTPMDQAPPGMPQFAAPEPPIHVTDVRELLDGTHEGLAEKLDGGSVEYADSAIDRGEREPTPDDLLVFRGVDGIPRMTTTLAIYNQFIDAQQPDAVMEDGTVIDHKMMESEIVSTLVQEGEPIPADQWGANLVGLLHPPKEE